MKLKLLKSFKQFAPLLAALVLTNSVLLSNAERVKADQYDDQIAAIKADVVVKQAKAAELSAQADTLANKIAGLQTQIGILQNQINENSVKQKQLAEQIKEAEAKLVVQKAALGLNLRAIYLEGDVSTVEMLAGSGSISEYVDKQQYLDSLQKDVSDSVSKITSLRDQLETSKKEIERLIRDQEAQKGVISAQQAEVDKILADTQGQEAQYQTQIKASNSQIAGLRQQQAAENARRLAALLAAEAARAKAAAAANGNNNSGSSNNSSTLNSSGTSGLVLGGGGYPAVWAFAPIDSLVDSWGMYNRECVSYTAFRVANSGRYMPYWGGIGNAYEWPRNARAAGIPVDGSPRVGDVAIWQNPPYGHAMYVEKVYGNGWIRVSQYNFNWAGMYNEMDIPAYGTEFIHF
jgi:peptidoglycan DL-endopeptidase CwlO